MRTRNPIDLERRVSDHSAANIDENVIRQEWALTGPTTPNPERRLTVWKSHRATQTLETSSNGGSRLIAEVGISEAKGRSRLIADAR
jgi:hypothetical protein